MKQFISIILVFFSSICFADQFPDFGGVLDFSKSDEIADQLFILTNPKSGSHLLLYSIMKVTKRPLRGRVPYWHFENNPPFYPPENMMGYPLDFSKPTTYWGHEYSILERLNQRGNKLIFILRDYKENVLSNLILKYRELLSSEELDCQLGFLLKNEIFNEGLIFKEYLTRLRLFHNWKPDYRCLVMFEDLVANPQIFVPQVMAFIEDNSEYVDFIDNYEGFKVELMEKYKEKENRTGSGSSLKYFAKKVSSEILEEVDDYVKSRYPMMWKYYLENFSEKTIVYKDVCSYCYDSEFTSYIESCK